MSMAAHDATTLQEPMDAATDNPSATPEAEAGVCDSFPPTEEARPWSCAQPLSCPSFRVLPDGQPHTFSTANVATLGEVRCLLLALRDGQPGEIEFSVEQMDGMIPNYQADNHTLNILPDGTVVRSLVAVHDLSSAATVAHFTRKPEAFFDACLQLPFGQELYACLTQWYAESADGCPICPNPGELGDLCDLSSRCATGLGCCFEFATASERHCLALVDGTCPPG